MKRTLYLVFATCALFAGAITAQASQISLADMHAGHIGGDDDHDDDHDHFEPYGTKWGDPVLGTGVSLTYSFIETGTSCRKEFDGCTFTAFEDFMPSGWKAAVEAAFSAWSAVANIRFTEVRDRGEQFDALRSSADLRIGGHVMDGERGTLAHAYFPPPNGQTAAGDIHFDTSENWVVGFDGPGYDIFQVMAHEIGHAIGLSHTDTPNSLMNPAYTESFRGLQASDIAGAQYLYGASNLVAAVPLPASLPLMASGLALAGVLRLRRTGAASEKA